MFIHKLSIPNDLNTFAKRETTIRTTAALGYQQEWHASSLPREEASTKSSASCKDGVSLRAEATTRAEVCRRYR
ncbi:hypothetical protein JTE90_001944 [Oedothorax gibbosus]|uniref:Uncharacterized protein n=1 Tax=Oedothorax gibbosus TaxID=931172 RepID=A0AAV6VWI1_9ARAC|nr:hypothetical protein JTE90_001944 [Oedothorax gibbosus]